MKNDVSRTELLVLLLVAVICAGGVFFYNLNQKVHLKREGAQQAVNAGFNRLLEIAAVEGMPIQGNNKRAVVIGIQENSQAKEAVAEVQFYDSTFRPPGFLPPFTLDKGKAHFKRDGNRWVMTLFTTGNHMYVNSLAMNTPVY